MKGNFLFILFFITIINSFAESWIQKANYPTTYGRMIPFSFSIGGKGYVGCGVDIQNFIEHKDFWEYNPSSNSWSQKADFGGLARVAASSFSIGNYGYAGLGNASSTNLQDFWQYDPSLNIWNSKAQFPGGGRGGAIGFSINDSGYICCGNNGGGFAFNDLWKYDPIQNSWTQKNSFPGVIRTACSAFVISGKGYVGLGRSVGGNSFYQDFYEYNPSIDSWNQISDFSGNKRANAASFSINDKGYVGTGDTGNVNDQTKDFWEYDPQTNHWTQKMNFPFPIMQSAYFSINNKGYIGLGCVSCHAFYEYDPNGSTQVSTTSKENLEVIFYPNPVTSISTISLSQNLYNFKMKILDVSGKEIKFINGAGNKIELRTNEISSGIYFYEIIQDEKIISKGKFEVF